MDYPKRRKQAGPDQPGSAGAEPASDAGSRARQGVEHAMEIHRLACGLSVGHCCGEWSMTPEMRGSVCVSISLQGQTGASLGTAIPLNRCEALALLVRDDLPRTGTSPCAQHLCLWISPETLADIAGECAEPFLRKLRSRSPLPVPVTAQALRIAHELGDALRTRTGCTLLRDARSLELLFCVLTSIPVRTRLTRDQKERLHHARQLLLADFAHPPTAEELARACGLNVLRLKQGFVSLYGQTIHALFQHERMQTAWQLIESGKMDVGSAGFHVGYSNLSHFSDAFRRRFGLLPSDLKRRSMQAQSGDLPCVEYGARDRARDERAAQIAFVGPRPRTRESPQRFHDRRDARGDAQNLTA